MSDGKCSFVLGVPVGSCYIHRGLGHARGERSTDNIGSWVLAASGRLQSDDLGSGVRLADAGRGGRQR